MDLATYLTGGLRRDDKASERRLSWVGPTQKDMSTRGRTAFRYKTRDQKLKTGNRFLGDGSPEQRNMVFRHWAGKPTGLYG
jgi:hypothetical protein